MGIGVFRWGWGPGGSMWDRGACEYEKVRSKRYNQKGINKKVAHGVPAEVCIGYDASRGTTNR